MQNFDFNIYKDFFKDIQKVNTDFVVSGSCAGILHLNKVHRICNDIDIHFETNCDISNLIQLINDSYEKNKYEIIEFKENIKNKEAKILVHKKYEISLDIYTNSFLDYDIVDEIKIIKLEKLISNKLRNISSSLSQNQLIIKNLYDLEFLIKLDYKSNLIFNYLTKEVDIENVFLTIDNIINNFNYYDFLFLEYSKNNILVQDFDIKEIINYLIILKQNLKEQ